MDLVATHVAVTASDNITKNSKKMTEKYQENKSPDPQGNDNTEKNVQETDKEKEKYDTSKPKQGKETNCEEFTHM